MDESDENDSPKEPQITSSDPQERIAARRLRIQRRLAEAERLANLDPEEERRKKYELYNYDKRGALVPTQIESSMDKLLQAQEDGREIVTNVQVASVQYEVQRQQDARARRKKRLELIANESHRAAQKFKIITERWSEISALNDPLDINDATESQREKCLELIASKDALIEVLREELKMLDERFVTDLEKQEENLSIVIDRIDEHVKLMRKTYMAEMELLEAAVDAEREDIFKKQHEQWSLVAKEHEKLQVSGIRKIYAMQEEHDQLHDKMMVEELDYFKTRKLELFDSYQKLQMERERMKSLCLINTEKLNYNYDLLQKRDEENQVIKSQQKRMIMKLQDTIACLRKKIKDDEAKMSKEIKKLTTEILTLHKEIRLTEQKADSFALGNCEKYLQMWDFNQRQADELIKQLLNADKVFYEHQLGLDWIPPEQSYFNKEDLPSYRDAMKLIAESAKPPQRQKPYYTKPLEKKPDFIQTRITKLILEKIVDNTGFLAEEKLNALLEPFSTEEQHLVGLDNIFTAIGLSDVNDLKMLANYFYPYTECETCIMEGSLTSEQELCAVWCDSEGSPKDDHPTDKHGDGVISSTKDPEHDVLGEVNTVVHQRLEIMDTVIKSELQNDKNSEKHQDQSLKPKQPTILEPPVLPQSQTEPESSLVSVCSNPSHKPSIDPIYVLKVLREFMEDFYVEKTMEGHASLENVMAKQRISLSRLISDKDVKDFWENYRLILPKEKEEVWDSLFNGLKTYLSCLKERHNLNEKIKKLKKVNTDMRLLLQNYITEPYCNKVRKELMMYMHEPVSPNNGEDV